MAINMKVNGKIIYLMEKDVIFQQMALFLNVNFQMERNLLMELYITQIKIYIMEIL